MSKTALKKEVSQFTKEQLIELLLDVYDARKEAKEYLEFYLNPDSAKLYAKYQAVIEKEMRRSKYGHSKARISVIKNAIKTFESFQPDIEYRFEIYFFSILQCVYFERYYYFSDAMINGVLKLVAQYLDLADANLTLDAAISNLNQIIDNEDIGSTSLKRQIKNAIRDYLESQSL